MQPRVGSIVRYKNVPTATDSLIVLQNAKILLKDKMNINTILRGYYRNTKDLSNNKIDLNFPTEFFMVSILLFKRSLDLRDKVVFIQ